MIVLQICIVLTFSQLAQLKDSAIEEKEDYGRFKRHFLPYRYRRRQIYSLCNYPEMTCSPFDKYRRLDGRCNNPSSPYWGAKDGTLRRIVRNYYDDGMSEPRSKAVDGKDLPNVRFISNTISTDKTGDLNGIFTNLHQVFDQDGKKYQCCTPELNQNGGEHDDVKTGGPCYPINIPVNDSFFQPRRCMNFVRSVVVTDNKMKCRSAAREQMNKLTSFIDASQVYGLTEKDSSKLRIFKLGLMKVTPEDLIPEDSQSQCQKRQNSSDFCFLAGDSRVNEHPGLSAFHIIFVRLHNKIARELHTLNRRNRLWNDERIYQEARKIVGAISQHIVYSEYLPKLVGPVATLKHQLTSPFGGQHQFKSSLDPRIFNAFSTAAFRYGHSSIPNEWTYGNDKVPLLAMFNKPGFIQDFEGKGLDMIVEGMITDSSQPADEQFSNGVRNTLFKTFKMPGLDLVALNIQRGRDHGLAPYNVYREYCGLKPLTSFDNSTEQLKKLAQVYSHPDDVDLFIGGMTEPHVVDGIVGETFACLIATQFHNLKYGDRFYFENLQTLSAYLPVNPASFTIRQIQAIKKMSIARVICDTTDIKYIPRNAFFHPSAGLRNRRVSCKDYYSLPGLDLQPWRAGIYF